MSDIPSYGDASIAIVLRLIDRTKRDLDASLKRIKKQINSVNQVEVGGSTQERKQGSQLLATELQVRKAMLGVSQDERRLVEEIVKARQSGIRVTRAEELVSKRLPSLYGKTLTEMKEITDLRQQDLKDMTEQLKLRQQIQTTARGTDIRNSALRNSELLGRADRLKLESSILTSRNRLTREIVDAEMRGLDAAEARRVLQKEFNLGAGTTVQQAKALTVEREAELRHATAVLRAKTDEAKAEQRRQAQEKSGRSTLGETGLMKARAELMNTETRIRDLLSQASAAKLSTRMHELTLQRQLNLTEKTSSAEAQKQLEARKAELALTEAQLRSELKREAIRRRMLGLDPMGKVFGGARGRFPMNTVGGVVKSFTTLEGLRTRMISLFAGQIGTLFIYGAALSAIVGFVNSFVGGQIQVQKELAKTSIVMESSGSRLRHEMQLTEDQARSWARSHSQSAKDVLKAQFEILAAGFDINRTLKTVPAVGLLSQGGLIPIERSAEITSSNLQTFARDAMDAIEQANVMQTVAAETQAQIEDLGVSLSYAGGQASSARIPFADIASVIGALGTLGLRGSKGGTSLNQMLTALTKKEPEIRKLGITTTDAEGRLLPLVDILAQFRREFGIIIDQGEAKILSDIFNIRGARAMTRLIQDVTVLPRVMERVENSETEIFKAAEKGSQNAYEAFKVLTNQIKDFLLFNGEVANVLERLFDSWTNRTGLRAAENIRTGAAGVTFEQERLSDLLKRDERKAAEYVVQLIKANRERRIGGQLGEKLLELDKRASVIEAGGLPLFFGFGDERRVSAARIARRDILEIMDLEDDLTETLKRGEDYQKGRRSIKSAFGILPVTPMTSKDAEKLIEGDLATLREYAESQRAEAERMVVKWRWDTLGAGPFAFAGKEQVAKYEDLEQSWRAFLDSLSKEGGKAVEVEAKKRKDALRKLQHEVRKSELASLEAISTQDYAVREEIARKRLRIELDDIAERFKADKEKIDEQKHTTLKNTEAINAEVRALNEKRRHDETEAERIFQNKLKEIKLDRLREEYEAASKLRRLNYQSELQVLGGREKIQRQREEVRAGIDSQLGSLWKRRQAGDFVSEKQYQDERAKVFREAEIEFRKLNEAEKRYDIELQRVRQDGTLAEAREYLTRLHGEAAYREERKQIKDRYEMDAAILSLQYANDEEMLDAQLKKRQAQRDEELTNIQVKHIEAVRSKQMNSLQTISSGFAGMAEYVSSVYGEATGKILNDMSLLTNSAMDALSLVREMRAGGISGLAGGIGLIGVFASTFSRIFSDSEEATQQQVQRIADEFRHVEGQTVSAEFGQAKTVIVRVALNPNFQILGDWSEATQRKMALLLSDDLIPIFQEAGYIERD